jgi:hypothetical protein
MFDVRTFLADERTIMSHKKSPLKQKALLAVENAGIILFPSHDEKHVSRLFFAVDLSLGQ